MGHRAVHHRRRRRVHHAAAGGAVPDGGPAGHRRHRGLSGRIGPDAGRQRAHRHRAGDERLARADLHGVGGAGQRQRHADADLLAQHQPGPGAGGRAEPPEPRHAAAAVGGDAAGRARRQVAQQLPAVHDPHLHRPGLHAGGAGRLCGTQRAARDPAHRRRGPGAAVRHRARDAHLDRPGQAGGLRHVGGRREQRHPRAERAGVVGHAGRFAEPGRADHLRHHRGRRPAVQRRAVRQHRAARQCRRLERAHARRGAHRAGGADLRHLGAAERQAVHRHRRAAVAHRQRAGHGQGSARAHGRAAALLPAGHELRHPLRHLALRADLHRQGGGDAARGGGAGVPGDVPVPAELALHHHPDHRRAGGAARHLHGAADAGLFDQRAHHVRHGAGGGHRGRRRHRRRRERRTHHERGRPAALAGHAQGDGADLRRHRRRHRGADLGVRAAGLLHRRGGQHLPPVLGGDGLVDRLLGLPGAVADTGPVRHAAQAGGSRPPSCQARLLRLVQPRLLGHRQELRRAAGPHAQAQRTHDGGVSRHHRRRHLAGAAAAELLPAERGPGLHHRQRAAAAGRHHQPRAGGDGAGRGLHAQAARGQEHGQRARLQLLRPGAERGAGLRDAEGLGRATRPRADRRRRWPDAPSAR